MAQERVRMERLMIDRVQGWNELGNKEKVVMVMDRECRDEAEARVAEKMWRKRFVSSAPSHHLNYVGFCIDHQGWQRGFRLKSDSHRNHHSWQREF